MPLLSLGIPGSATSAIIFGALTIHGLIPGPNLFSEHSDIVYILMVGLAISCIIMTLLGLFGIKLFTKILKVKVAYIIPAVLVFSLFGAYSARNSIFDIFVAVAFGLIGLLFKRFGIPIAPSILGMILGNMAETNLRQSIVIAHAKQINIIRFIMLRPISIVIALLLVILIYSNVKIAMKNSKS